MELGIFSRIFPRPTIEETLEAIADQGFSWVQWKFLDNSWMMGTITERQTKAEQLRRALDIHGIRVAALSGTYNIIHPDKRLLQEGERYVKALAEVAPILGTNMITLCSGTRDPHNMWLYHPENRTDAAWRAMIQSLTQLIHRTEQEGIVFGIEPEHGNVVSDAVVAKRLLDTLGRDRLAIIMDAANLLSGCPAGERPTLLAAAFELLGSDIGLAHGKDLTDAESHDDVLPGTGFVDFQAYTRLLQQSPYQGPLILHGFTESQTPTAHRYVRGVLEKTM